MDGVHLGKDGRAQAERLASRMQREHLTAIYSSPLERAEETAKMLSRASEIADVTLVDALDEIDFGSWSGLGFEELDQDPAWRRWNAMRSLAATPSGETMLMVQSRIVAFISDLIRQGAETVAALVSHADVIKAAVIYYLGLCLDSWLRFEIAPASITTLRIDAFQAQVTLLNETVG
jgi:broad specificity phosphatase PhoE